MALNIVAERKISLKDFAEGWDNTFLLVRSSSEEKRIEWGKLLTKEGDDESSTIESLRQAVSEVIIGGKVISTADDGTHSLVAVSEGDIPTVVHALNIFWLQEVLMVSTGTDRLKAMI